MPDDQNNKEQNNKERPKDNDRFLAGRLLLAMPGMGDPRFHKAVIYICAHDENGAMGLVINHLLPGIDMHQMFAQLNIEIDENSPTLSGNVPVLSGGPVETSRGFILHSSDFSQDDTIRINKDIGVTGTIDALRTIADGEGPEQMLFVLGYAGWGAGQLDDEIQKNAWLVVDTEPDLVFETDPEEMWEKAVATLGFDPAMLSAEAGRA